MLFRVQMDLCVSKMFIVELAILFGRLSPVISPFLAFQMKKINFLQADEFLVVCMFFPEYFTRESIQLWAVGYD